MFAYYQALVVALGLVVLYAFPLAEKVSAGR
jgi:hypothetical protein